MRTAGRAFAVYVALILVFVAIGFIQQTVGQGGVIAFVALLLAGAAVRFRRRRRPPTT